jgi:hypothetical protein
MSFGGGSSGGGGGNTVTQVTPYGPAQPALNQILAEAGTIYGQGPVQYVPPSAQTLTGLGIQEQLGTAAAQQFSNTLQGNYLNPFLSPIIQGAGKEAYNTVASQFSGAGRTPGSPMSQQQVADIVAQRALPYAFQSYGQERQNQLGVAQAMPSLTQTGSQLESLQRELQLAPFQSLQNYASIVSPIAGGFPIQQKNVAAAASNPLSMGFGGALLGSQLGPALFDTTAGTGALYGGGLGFLAGLI